MSNQEYLDKILDLGYEKANDLATKKVNRLKEIVGFY